MKTKFKNKRIAGILGILPETICYYDDEVIDGKSIRNQRIKKNMGYSQRYRAKNKTTTAMLCNAGMEYLLSNQIVTRDEIGAILVVSFTPDFFVPGISNLIQMENGLPNDILTMDFWEGCAGYIEGLQRAFAILDHLGEKKVLLFTGDVICRMEDIPVQYDMPVYGGDGASITILENCVAEEEIFCSMNICGLQRDMISFKQGGFADIFHQNEKFKTDITSEAFRFFQSKIPQLVCGLLNEAGETIETVEMFDFIQANKLAARKYADSLNIPYDKVPMDLVARYGDSSATLNPMGIIDFYGEKLLQADRHKVLICGYGAGLKWGAIILSLGGLTCCERLETDL